MCRCQDIANLLMGYFNLADPVRHLPACLCVFVFYLVSNISLSILVHVVLCLRFCLFVSFTR